jgi:uncharacterized protein YijF (DUF1287 family)
MMDMVSFVLWLLPLAVGDVGIFPDLDPRVELTLPAALDRGAARVSHDPRKRLLVLWAGERPVKAYPAGDDGAPARPADVDELRGIERGPAPRARDVDGDGIPDELDVMIGARKVALNGAAYGQGYKQLEYPGGDVPRDKGVCTDTIVRALRNAGIDLQKEVFEDIKRARAVYGSLVKTQNASIDHRRVKTLLPYFQRHFQQVDAKAPYRAGEVVFFDTFPKRAGPDHIGIVSDVMGPSGVPMVINNWTDGFKDSDMDLLPTIPVTHRFRIRPR